MPQELKQRAVWCVIDFNRAPSSIDNIENYVCETFLDNAENLQFDPTRSMAQTAYSPSRD